MKTKIYCGNPYNKLWDESKNEEEYKEKCRNYEIEEIKRLELINSEKKGLYEKFYKFIDEYIKKDIGSDISFESNDYKVNYKYENGKLYNNVNYNFSYHMNNLDNYIKYIIGYIGADCREIKFDGNTMYQMELNDSEREKWYKEDYVKEKILSGKIIEINMMGTKIFTFQMKNNMLWVVHTSSDITNMNEERQVLLTKRGFHWLLGDLTELGI